MCDSLIAISVDIKFALSAIKAVITYDIDAISIDIGIAIKFRQEPVVVEWLKILRYFMLAAIDPQTCSTDRIETIISLLAVGGLFIIVWLIVDCAFKLIALNSEFKSSALGRDGQIRLDEFAIRSNIHIAVARWYLDSKARQFGGLRELDDVGDTVYLFGEGRRAFLRQQMALLEEQPTDRVSK